MLFKLLQAHALVSAVCVGVMLDYVINDSLFITRALKRRELKKAGKRFR